MTSEPTPDTPPVLTERPDEGSAPATLPEPCGGDCPVDAAPADVAVSAAVAERVGALFGEGAPDPSVVDLAMVNEMVERYGRGREAVIPLLQALQKQYRYLPEVALRHVLATTDISAADLWGVATFFPRFRHQPVGRHLVSVCHGTACHVKGARLVSEALQRHLNLHGNADTTGDGLFTLQRVDCLGCCTLAPVVQIDGVTYGHVTPDAVDGVLQDFLRQADRAARQPRGPHKSLAPGQMAEVRIGVGSCCIAGGSLDVREALEAAIREYDAPVLVRPVGCVGMCHQTPLVEVLLPGKPPVTYARVQAADAAGIVRKHFRPRGLRRRVRALVDQALDRLLTDETWEPITRYALDVRDGPVCSFLGPQEHLATELCGAVDPLDLDAYRRHGGFEALARCVKELTPAQVIETITASGLRGRGGAGFPTGRKWQLTRQAPGDRKYVVCNGDEGDPGAFMDRMLLESYAYRVLEGLAIAAYAVGAHEGVLYVRAEYPLAVRRLWQALAKCEAAGLLGRNILGTGFDLQLVIMEGAGAFVCGEETGLIASLEGRRGMPSLRPPFPAEQGLWDRPTNVNNVETLALVPWIMRHGPAAFAQLGTDQSQGTKVFSLTGKVLRGGLVEVPMGITIRQIVDEIGGGVAPGRTFKAVQIGGPSGGCIPAALSGTPVDYEALAGVGAIMGSGGLVVMDDTDCMVDVARYFCEFTHRESCGKCTFCRVGTRRMLDILDRLCTGKGRHNDLDDLEELGRQVKAGSLCGLGQTAPNPVLSTLRYFREEYEAHLAGRCPAGKCKALITYVVNERCIGCTLCAQKCPGGAIPMTPYQRHSIDPALCLRCNTCRQVCPAEAISVQ
jgi:NADH-quinone oxidoreductase subunit F